MNHSNIHSHKQIHRTGRRLQGFTLIELLTVVTIMLVLMGIATPFLSRFLGPANFTQNVTKVSTLLEQARQYAVTQNTYVWVAFYQEAAGADPANPDERLAVAIIASTDGTNPFDWTTPTVVDVATATNLQMLSKMEWLKSTRIANTSALAAFGASAKKPSNTGVDLSSDLTFRITKPGTSALLDFDRVLAFSPQGDAKVDESPVAFADFAIQPVRGNQDDQTNFAIIQISGLTGLSRVYRQ